MMPKGIYIRKPFSKEHKMNLSKASKGYKKSEEHKERISKTLKRKGIIPPSQLLPNKSIRNRRGYNFIKIKGIWIEEHHYIYLTENTFGHTFIPDGWEVHHINGIKIDNRIENLIIMPHSEHMILHHKQNGYYNRWENKWKRCMIK